MPPSCPRFAAAFDSHSDQLLGALQRRLCVVSTWKKNDSDPHCLPVHTISVSWLLSGDLFSDAE